MGEALADVRVRINACGTVRCEPQWQWDLMKSQLPDHDLWYAWAGVGTLRHESGECTIHRGSLYLLRPGQEYHARHDPARRLGVCYIHFDYLGPTGAVIDPGPAVLPLQSQVRDPGIYETLLRRVVRLHESANPLERQAACRLMESVLLTLPADRLESAPAGSGDPERDRRLDAIARWVREHPGERVTVEQLAEQAAYAVDHFTRLFTERVGKRPVAYLIECRIDRAKELLSTSALSVKQVAAALGYSDLFYFSRQFKQQTGLPPALWRQRFRAPASTKR